MKDELHTVFSLDQLAMIESAFEQASMGPSYDPDIYHYGLNAFAQEQEKRLKSSVAFCFRIIDPEIRLRLIMENIIANNGEFIP